jgi:hypothetical protein
MKQYFAKTILSALSVAAALSAANAQDSDLDAYRRRAQEEFGSFQKQRTQEFEDFRRKRNEEYAAFMRQKWEELNAMKATPKPVIPDIPVKPVEIDEKEKEKAPIDNEIKIDEVLDKPVAPPAPPAPIAPIVEIEEDAPAARFEFEFYGTPCRVRLSDKLRFRLPATSNDALANAWQILSGEAYNNLTFDCLKLRSDLALCDWAYFQLTEVLCNKFFGSSTNEAALMQAFLLMQSGYKLRLARDSRASLHLLFASDYQIYGHSYFVIDGERFYRYKQDGEARMEILAQAYSGEQQASLIIAAAQNFKFRASNERTLASKRYPEASAQVATNSNLMEFYNTYPSSTINADFMTRWKFYAQTPLSQNVQRQLYPALRQAVKGKTEVEATDILLNFVQTALEYGYDDEIWGQDRAFFADESLHYPYSDCEDRSILFVRLVRDLLGLETLLVYYPGHLATAVQLKGQPQGDYLLYRNLRYLVCDPTYIGAPVGRTMPGMDNASAKVVVIER